ncbi:H-NS family nucleoid-associated regulatory protein [Burkholderia gladioli]|uniref:H-NS histone family protein n=1 Tax=Burkholderia gladioli TaxID=28095 RepID=UPI001640FFCD|nr:H-NS histone family protein [Burkholderia gladioli]
MSSYQELKQQLATLQSQVDAARRVEMREVIDRVRALVDEYGLSDVDIFGSISKKRRKHVAKYCDPVSGKTWSGNGRPPRWLDPKDVDRFLIKKVID